MCHSIISLTRTCERVAVLNNAVICKLDSYNVNNNNNNYYYHLNNTYKLDFFRKKNIIIIIIVSSWTRTY